MLQQHARRCINKFVFPTCESWDIFYVKYVIL